MEYQCTIRHSDSGLLLATLLIALEGFGCMGQEVGFPVHNCRQYKSLSGIRELELGGVFARINKTCS
jgi:hypothetical protein